MPDRIERVFAAGPPASILLYVLAPERMIGWPRAPHADELPYIAPAYRDLPEVGWLTGRGDSVNLEVLLQSKPDLIFDFGSVRDTYVSLAERVQAQTGIPYLLIDGTFANTAAAVRLLGGVLGVEERAERIAAYVEQAFAELDALMAEVPEAERPQVYLARGPAGLETGLRGSINTEIIERVGAVNVAFDPSGARRGIVEAPIEQVVFWNPGVVITWDRTFYENVWNDFYWLGVDAVANQRVYLSPTAPFGWIDRPPSINRMIGLQMARRPVLPGAGQTGFACGRRGRSTTCSTMSTSPTPTSTASSSGPPAARLDAWRPARLITPLLTLGLVALALAATFVGPYPISLGDALHATMNRLSGAIPPEAQTLDTVLFFVRLPRIAAALVVGGGARRGRRRVSGPVPQPAGLARHPGRLRRRRPRRRARHFFVTSGPRAFSSSPSSSASPP